MNTCTSPVGIPTDLSTSYIYNVYVVWGYFKYMYTTAVIILEPEILVNIDD